MIYSGKSDIGMKRASNQDSFSITKPAAGVLLCVICDGMGGMRGGNVASELAVTRFVSEVAAWFKEKGSRYNAGRISGENNNKTDSPGGDTAVLGDNINGNNDKDISADKDCGLADNTDEEIKTTKPNLDGKKSDLTDKDFTSLLERSAAKANKAVIRRAKRDVNLSGMGTTLIAAMLIGEKLYVANVGDSRLYLITAGKKEVSAPESPAETPEDTGSPDEYIRSPKSGKDAVNTAEIKRITRDHSYVQYLIDLGQLTPAEAERSPFRNAITRAVGKEDNLETDTFVVDMHDCNGAYILLCSDGLYNFLSEDEFGKIVLDDSGENANTSEKEQKKYVDEKVERLVNAANKNGGGDNITAVLIKYVSNGSVSD